MKTIIGRKDKADFPELFLKNISLKVDTGAYTSTIHCHHITEIVIDEEKFVEFQLLDPSHSKFWTNKGKYRITRYFFMDNNIRLFKKFQTIYHKYLPRRKFLKDIKPYKGSQWWTITSECANYILEFTRKYPKFIKFFKHTLLPDEIFFHTIIYNSLFSKSVINNNLRYINWNKIYAIISNFNYPYKRFK